MRNRVTYAYNDGVGQWWSNGPLGFEQGLTVAHAPAAGTGSLAFGFAVSGSLHPRLAGTSVQFVNARGASVLSYSDLTATDARGRALPSTMSVLGGRLYLQIDTRGAHYPISVDPVVQLTKLAASDGQAGDFLGQSGAVAVAGNIVAVGTNTATEDTTADPTASSAGAVYIFVEPSAGWGALTNESAKLTAPDEDDGWEFGTSVAMSTDASTIAVGAEGGTAGGVAGAGEAYVFTEPSGGWSGDISTAATLTSASPNAISGFGSAIAVSGTSTVFVGAPFDNNESGYVYIFNKPASGGWVSATSSNTLSTSASGSTLIGSAVAATSNTAVVGGAFGDLGKGVADVYVEPSGGWGSTAVSGTTTQNAILEENTAGGTSGDVFGSSVAISGTTVAVGAPGVTVGSNASQGAVWEFTQPSGGWSGTLTPTAELTNSAGAANDQLGDAVGTNGTAIFAAADGASPGGNAQQGAVYEFDQPTTGSWATTTTPTSTFTSSDGAAGDSFGFSLAVSGPNVLVGADAATVGANLEQGAAYLFLQTAPPSVTTQPANATVAAGGTATFTAAASGSPTPTVQWQVSTNSGSTWANDTTDAGNTTGTLTVAHVATASPAVEYRAVFTNSAGTANSNAATLSVTSAPAITTQPTNQAVVAGATATFTAAASGTPAPTVQWQSAPSGSSTFTNISGATSTTLNVTSTTASQNGNQYRAVFTNTGGTATTTVATLTVETAPAVTTSPTSVTVTAGATATFTAAASGNPAPTVQWQSAPASAPTTFTNISGATSTTLSVTGTTASQNGTVYRAVFTNAVSSVNSGTATLTVNFAPIVTTPPANVTVNAGSTATFTVADSANPAATVQWQSALASSPTTFTNISGATSATLSVTSTTASQNGNQYRAVLTNSVGTTTARRRRSPSTSRRR